MIDPQLPDDRELDPTIEPNSSRAWLNILDSAERAFEQYQNKSDGIDKLYADLGKLSTDSRDRQFQMFWANVEVLKPTIYSRPPIPVVVPRFKDRRPLYRTSSELLERCCVTAFEGANIDAVMLLVRDDLAILDRGQAWARYVSDDKGERVEIDHLNRRDFLHGQARNWTEVPWVARRGWLTLEQMKKRFPGKPVEDAIYNIRKEDNDRGAADKREKCGVWEIWSKDENRVVWVTEGIEELLDSGKPHLELEGFFPCPRPAYGTLQRASLVPIPNMLFYKDQLEEINELTARIHALSDAVKVRGFYPAGAGEIGDAIEAAVKSADNRKVLVPISNWAAFGGGSAKDVIVWLPIDMIVGALKELIELRRQIIEDVYQITGLSDIMRGESDANETLGAQQLKSQYGSIRIRDRQAELVRFARDLVRITAEIMAENFQPKTLLEMSQVQLPTDAEHQKAAQEITAKAAQEFEGQLQQAMQNPEIVQAAQQNPQMAEQQAEQLRQQIMSKAEAELEKLKQKPTVEQVTQFIRDSRIRPFVLEIETDSTIQPDEQAEKAARAEFLTALAAALAQLGPMVQQQPATAPFAGEILKFAVAPFRVGREMDASIEEFVDQLNQKAKEPPPPSPEAEKLKAEMDRDQKKFEADMQAKQADQQAQTEKLKRDDARAEAEHQRKLEMMAAEEQRKLLEQQTKAQDREADRQMASDQHNATMEGLRTKGDFEKQKFDQDMTQTKIKGEMDAKSRQFDNDAKAMDAGMPPSFAYEEPKQIVQAIVAEMQQDRQMTTALVEQMAQQTQAMIAALTAPKQVTTPDGRTFTATTARMN